MVAGVEDDIAAQALCGGAAECEAQADAHLELVELDEAVEDVLCLFLRNATASILDNEFQLAVGL